MSRKFKNSKVTKVISGLTGLMTAVVMVGGALVVPASAATAAELQAQIDLLLSQVKSLQTTSGSGTGTSSVGGGYTFTRNLKLGSTGADVKALQQLLNQDADTLVAVSGAGSVGKETTTFGPATRRAVIKFQEKYADEILTPVGLTKGTGTFGPSSRAKANELGGEVVVVPPTGTTYPAGCTSAVGFSPTTGQPCNGTVVVVPPTTTAAGTLTVSSAVQPANSLAPKGTSRVPFTTLTLTAGGSDVSVTGVTVTRAGLAQDAAFAGVVLLNSDGTQNGIAKTLNSDHTATVGDPFTVKAGTSMTLTVAGNMATDETLYSGQVAQLNVVGVVTTATVSGTFPILGAQQTINNTLSVGTATFALSSFDPATAQSKQIGETNYKASGIRITAGSAEKVLLRSIRWYQSGSAASGDLANVVTHVDGDSTLYATTISSDGKYYTTIFPGTGLLIDKGLSKDVYVSLDLVGAGSSARTVQFDIYKNTDIYMVGETYGYGIIGTATSNCNATASTATTGSEFINSSTSCASSGTVGTPFFSGSTLTIANGSVTTIQKATSVPAQNIAINVPNQVLGGYSTDIKGEGISVQNHVFRVATSSSPTAAGTVLLTNVTLVDENGTVVAGPIDATSDATYGELVSFTDTVTYKLGVHTYTLKGKVPSAAANGTTYIVSFVPSSGFTNSTGQTTGNSITWPSSTVTLNTMTVKAGSLVGSVSSQPTSQSIVAGGTSRLLANFQLDASQSGEDVRFSSLTASLAGVSFSTSTLSNCQLYNDAGTSLTTGSNVVNPATTATTIAFTLDSSYTVTKGTLKTVSVKCNIASGGTTGSTLVVGLSAIGSGTGVVSGNTITATYGSQTGPTMTINTGSFAASLDSAAPSYTVTGSSANVLATGVTANIITFRAANESVNLTKLGLDLTGTASSSASDLIQVTLWDGSTQIGTATFTGSSASATSTLTLMNPAGVLLPKDQDKKITVKADLAAIGTNQAGSQGHLVKVDYLNAEGTGAESGTTLYSTGSTAVAGLRVFKSYPTVALDTLSVTGGGIASDGNLIRFKVTASPSGDVGLTSFNIKIATTSAQITNLNAFAFTDAAYSQGVSGVSSGGQLKSANVSLTAIWADSTSVIPMTVTDSDGNATAIQIPAGQTRYFQVHGTVTPSTTTYSVGTTLLGDTAYPGLATTFMAQAGTVEGLTAGSLDDFVWSPNATTTSSRTHADWTNGYQLPGLPSSGLSQNRTN